MLISDSYRNLNSRLHAGGSYGRKGDKWAAKVLALIQTYGAQTVLDYGCGQGALKRGLALDIQEYDPAVPEKSALPKPADLVVCTDVLEHVEPDCLEAVLDHLQQLTLDVLYVVISTRPAKKFLADGRNAHLIVESQDYWRLHLSARFKIDEWIPHNDEFSATLMVRD